MNTLSDGTTVVAASNTNRNLGILFDNITTNTDVTVVNVNVTDDRATPLTNFSIVPATAPPSTFFYAANRMSNLRNAYNLIEYTNDTREWSGVQRFDGNIKAVGGVTTGSNSSTGTVLGDDINGAAGSTRQLRFQSAASTRWATVATGTTESGSNAGTDLQITAYDDTGAQLSVPMTITRSNGTISISSPKIGTSILDSNGNKIIGVTPTASAVNYLAIQNAITGQHVAISAIGTDTNVGITFKTQGNGITKFHPGTDTITAAQFLKSDNSTVVMNIDTTNGRVGIGNSAAPTRTLDVFGQARIQNLLGSNVNAIAITGDVGSGTSPTISITGSDTAGKIVIVAGTSPTAASLLAHTTFGSTYPNVPYVELTPGNTGASALATAVYIDDATLTTTGFGIKTSSTLIASTTYIWYYHVIG